jgi:hypothetical protein
VPPLNLYARVRFSLPILHTGPRVQRASGIPCSLQFEGHETQTSGASRRENVDVYLLFEIRIEILFRHGEQAARHNKTAVARSGRAITRDVIAGLDPAIHPHSKTLLKFDGYAGQARV